MCCCADDLLLKYYAWVHIIESIYIASAVTLILRLCIPLDLCPENSIIMIVF
jgi:hypothetical protein